jgi:glycerol uptake facilitator-like aquaporin
MGGVIALLPYVGVDEIRGKVTDLGKALTAEFLGTMFLVLASLLKPILISWNFINNSLILL